jgi:Protein of unknown function (DUF2283).
MSKTRMVYFENEDVLHLSISEEPESGSVELSPNITAELNDKGELIGIEIIIELCKSNRYTTYSRFHGKSEA